MKKIVFFDIDNTLWDRRQNIPPSTVTAIRRLRENGHSAFLNSGRARGFINDPALLTVGFDGIVAACGCYVEIGGKVIKNKLIPQETVEKTIRVMKKYHLPLILEGCKSLYVDPEDFTDDPYYNSLRGRMHHEIPSISGFTGQWEINKLSINQTADMPSSLGADLDDYYELIIHADRFIELVPRGHSKATGMDLVCDALGVPLSDTFAIGDSTNDLDMIRHAGCGIAMGNASDDVKELADYVTAPLSQDGLAKALDHFGLL